VSDKVIIASSGIDLAGRLARAPQSILDSAKNDPPERVRRAICVDRAFPKDKIATDQQGNAYRFPSTMEDHVFYDQLPVGAFVVIEPYHKNLWKPANLVFETEEQQEAAAVEYEEFVARQKARFESEQQKENKED
jgi:hypothetical protein